MKLHDIFSFLPPGQLEAIRTFYAGINGNDSFDAKTEQASGVWSAEVHCSRGPILEKAGLAMVEMRGGTVDGASADIRLLQTLACPRQLMCRGLSSWPAQAKWRGAMSSLRFMRT